MTFTCGEICRVPLYTVFALLESYWKFRFRGVDLYTPFHFQKQAGIHARVLTYITIANAMVN